MLEFHEVSVIDAPAERCFDLARSVEVHLLDNSHCGEPTAAISGQTTGLVEMGQHVTWQARHLGVRQKLTTRVTAFHRPVFFQDTMCAGAFRSMQHDHFFRPLIGDRTEMTDILRICAPVPVLGRIAELLVLRRYMHGLLCDRCRVTKRVAESPAAWKQYLSHSEPAPAVDSADAHRHSRR